MMQHKELQHRFVKHIPEKMEPNVLYISIEYGSAAHSCCCGCGEEVVTPLTPTDWKLIYDGETVSLWPSIGNWNLRCRSHYIIERGKAVVARSWTKEQISAEKRRDRTAKAEFYGTEPLAPTPPIHTPLPGRPWWWERWTQWFSGLWR